MSKIDIYKIPTHEAGHYWGAMRDFLESALVKFNMDEKYPLDCVLRDLITGDAQGWIIIQDDIAVSAAVTELQEYPTGRAVNIFLMGGHDMKSWGAELTETLRLYAVEVGAKWVEAGTRDAIGKDYLLPAGYRKLQSSYSYEVH